MFGGCDSEREWKTFSTIARTFVCGAGANFFFCSPVATGAGASFQKMDGPRATKYSSKVAAQTSPHLERMRGKHALATCPGLGRRCPKPRLEHVLKKDFPGDLGEPGAPRSGPTGGRCRSWPVRPGAFGWPMHPCCARKARVISLTN